MAIIKITRDLIEKVTLTTHPKRVFVSSSVSPVNDEPLSAAGTLSPTGTLGQVSLMGRTNSVIKGIREFDPESSLFNEDQSELLINLKTAQDLSGSTTDIQRYLGSATSGSHISTDDGDSAGALITINSIPTNGHTVSLEYLMLRQHQVLQFP